MDFLNSQSDIQSQMSNCFALDEITSQEDYLMQDSNPQTTQSMKNNFTGNISSTVQKNYNLEVINEESNFSPIQSQINSNNNLRNIIEKKYKLSQQIDNLEIEKKNSEKISVQNNNNNLNYQKNNFDGPLTEKLSNLSQEFISKIDVFVNNGYLGTRSTGLHSNLRIWQWPIYFHTSAVGRNNNHPELAILVGIWIRFSSYGGHL